MNKAVLFHVTAKKLTAELVKPLSIILISSIAPVTVNTHQRYKVYNLVPQTSVSSYKNHP